MNPAESATEDTPVPGVPAVSAQPSPPTVRIPPLEPVAAGCGGHGWAGHQHQPVAKTFRHSEQLARQSADTGTQAIEARTMARQAQDLSRETAARLAVTETRLSEVSLQRSQLEELMQSLSRSRDENLVVDIESAMRLAQQQAQLTGSLEPLLAGPQKRPATHRTRGPAPPGARCSAPSSVTWSASPAPAWPTPPGCWPAWTIWCARWTTCPYKTPWPRRPPRAACKRAVDAMPTMPHRLRHGADAGLGGKPCPAAQLGGGARRSARSGAREPHRPARSHPLSGARPGVFSAREPQAQAAQCAPGRAGAPVRFGPR
jgi:hypothetical protein